MQAQFLLSVPRSMVIAQLKSAAPARAGVLPGRWPRRGSMIWSSPPARGFSRGAGVDAHEAAVVPARAGVLPRASG
jgi:hypothetical protein